MPQAFDTHPEVLRLRKALKRLIQESNWSIAEVSEQVGFNYYSILNAKQFLRAEHIFCCLDTIGKTPADLFAQVYGLRPPSEEEHRVAGIPQSEIEATVRRLVRPEALAEEERQERKKNGGGDG